MEDGSVDFYELRAPRLYHKVNFPGAREQDKNRLVGGERNWCQGRRIQRFTAHTEIPCSLQTPGHSPDTCPTPVTNPGTHRGLIYHHVLVLHHLHTLSDPHVIYLAS